MPDYSSDPTFHKWFVKNEPQLDSHLDLKFEHLPQRLLYHVSGNDTLVKVRLDPSVLLRDDWHHVLASCCASAIQMRRGTVMHTAAGKRGD